jgi:hypothetical protein
MLYTACSFVFHRVNYGTVLDLQLETVQNAAVLPSDSSEQNTDNAATYK